MVASVVKTFAAKIGARRLIISCRSRINASAAAAIATLLVKSLQ